MSSNNTDETLKLTEEYRTRDYWRQITITCNHRNLLTITQDEELGGKGLGKTEINWSAWGSVDADIAVLMRDALALAVETAATWDKDSGKFLADVVAQELPRSGE